MILFLLPLIFILLAVVVNLIVMKREKLEETNRIRLLSNIFLLLIILFFPFPLFVLLMLIGVLIYRIVDESLILIAFSIVLLMGFLFYNPSIDFSLCISIYSFIAVLSYLFQKNK